MFATMMKAINQGIVWLVSTKGMCATNLRIEWLVSGVRSFVDFENGDGLRRLIVRSVCSEKGPGEMGSSVFGLSLPDVSCFTICEMFVA